MFSTAFNITPTTAAGVVGGAAPAAPAVAPTTDDPCTPLPPHKTVGRWSHARVRRIITRQVPKAGYQAALAGSTTNVYMVRLTHISGQPGATLPRATQHAAAQLHRAQLARMAEHALATGMTWSKTSERFLERWADVGAMAAMTEAAERELGHTLATADRPLTWIPPALHTNRKTPRVARVLPGRLVWTDALLAGAARQVKETLTKPTFTAFAAKGEVVARIYQRRVTELGRVTGIYEGHVGVRVAWPTCLADRYTNSVTREGYWQSGRDGLRVDREIQWLPLRHLMDTEPQLLAAIPAEVLERLVKP